MHPKPKKRLGQNFLVDKNIQKKIIAACAFKTSDTVLEIGSGRGELTGLIAGKVNKVYAIEVDTFLCNDLRENLKGYANIKIIEQDILKFNLRSHICRHGVKAIGNIPYYITSPIIEHLLRYKDTIDTIFLTVQKEFARRIAALPGSKDYGAFSCFVQYYTLPKILFFIKKTSFLPQPKVDSCFLRLEIRKKPCVKVKKEELFFKIVRAAFGQRRKTLRNSLKAIILPQKLEIFFKKYNINTNIRPEDLSLEDFAKLVNI